MNNSRGIWRGKLIDEDEQIDRNEWVEGFLAKRTKSYAKIVDDDDMVHFVDPQTLGECTGQRDKNLDLTFEGDILEFQFEDIGRQSAYIMWNTKYACFTLVGCSDYFEYARISDGVIIGNIHDNPNYLEMWKE